MKKYYFIVSLLVCVNVCFSQNPEIKTELPTIIPPSPTVSALMKFEEVPVSNYTGIPDISIPLISSPTLSKDINLDIQLKYHASVGANDKASDVGLGWSLFAGGTISRTVRGLPDEILNYPGGQNGVGKIGIYQNAVQQNSNNYYYFKNNIANETQDFYKTGNQLTTQETNIGNEFLWSAAFTGKYDTEHDLWQFNFMGFSGRFYIIKNANNQLEVQPLDDYRIKIINNYAPGAPGSSNSGNLYIPTGFTVYDEKGYKYIFDVIETTRNFGAIEETYPVPNQDGTTVFQTSTSMYSDNLFNSSFHLSKVYGNNNNLLIDFQYSETLIKESFSDHTTLDNEYANQTGLLLNFQLINACQDFPALKSNSVSSNIVTVKKLATINVVNQAKISFEFALGRQDNNINNAIEASFLNSITLKDWNNNQIKKYSFEYNYSTVLNKRMILKKVNLLGNQNTFENAHEFSYENNSTNGKLVGRDYWGFLNLINPCELTTLNFRNTSDTFSTTDILQKIKYPTSGCAIFDYEANQYSFIGDMPITNFDENPYNWYQATYPLPSTFNASYNIYNIQTASVQRKVKFYPSIVVMDEASAVDSFILQKFVGNSWVHVANLICPNTTPSCCIELFIEPNIQYRVFRSFLSTEPVPNATLGIEYLERNSQIKEYLYGGGNRIRRIGYFKNDTPKDYYDMLNNSSFEPPQKEKNYVYTFFNNPMKSSGSLTYPRPLYNYYTYFKTQTNMGAYSLYCGLLSQTSDQGFVTYTSYNNFSVVKTHGADVGYKEVTVFETNNGKTEYTFTTPLDYPEEDIPNGPPYIPSKNYDYKRGLPLNESVYDNQNRKLIETISDYSFSEYLVHTGTRFKKPFGECYTGKVSDYSSEFYLYKSFLNGDLNDCLVCKPNFSTTRYFLCGLPLDIDKPKIMPYPIFEAYGWAKLTAKTTKNYFYEGNTQKIVQTDETYTYNPLNKKIAEQTVTNSNLNEVMKTKYFYLATLDTPTSKNNISTIEKVETYRGSELLSTNKINYVTNFPGNVTYLPQTITTSKGSNALETRVRYTAYDEFSNPLQVEQENGMKTSYIWGYNKSLPIAKIENMAYASIPMGTITNLQTISNIANNETNLLTALDALRTAYPSAMITTITHKPLIGISTVTDPKGDKMNYVYDEFNRLKEVRDKNNNLLSENEYHYKN